ncbi:hypothetical protein SRHO_G00175280 [Serrasalmus rhombeus]
MRSQRRLSLTDQRIEAVFAWAQEETSHSTAPRRGKAARKHHRAQTSRGLLEAECLWRTEALGVYPSEASVVLQFWERTDSGSFSPLLHGAGGQRGLTSALTFINLGFGIRDPICPS